MNGDTFLKLVKLYRVDMFGNVCIHENFDNKYGKMVGKMAQIVTQKCGFDENVESGGTLNGRSKNFKTVFICLVISFIIQPILKFK